ncbi:MAG: hypothetical protein ACI4Q5_10105 [Porcipelethomonas sp.]
MKAEINVEFNEASDRQEIRSGEEIKTLFGKLKKWLSDLKPIAFSGSYNDLSDTPSSLPADGGEAEKAVSDSTGADIAESFAKVKSNIALNRTTLGTQCRNLHDILSVNWYQPGKTSVASDGTVTTTITSDSRSFTYANSEHYITLEAGNYIITANTLEFAAGSSALIRGCNSDNQSLFALSVSSAGLHKAAFSLSEKTTIGIMYKLYSQTCTIMIRDADILDDTYEPYQPSLKEKLESYIASSDVDSEMSDTSVNPVQNKVIKDYIDQKIAEISGS